MGSTQGVFINTNSAASAQPANVEIVNNHALPDKTVLFSVGTMITGQWHLRSLLRYWWRNGRKL